MAEYCMSIVLGILSSFTASVVFLFFLSRLRPNIEISPYISYREVDGDKSYVIKIINRTKRPIINVRCRFNLVGGKSVPGGIIYHNKHLPLRREETFMIDKFDKNDKDANYAWRFVCKENIEAEWEEGNGSYLIFRVIATDSLSGLSKYHSRRFFTKRDCLRPGSHRFGDDLTVE